MKYKDYIIALSSNPYRKRMEYNFIHKDYNIDNKDKRRGTCETVEECKKEIDKLD